MTKLLRTIRLDPSDTFAFEKAAEPGEWAVPGSFLYYGEDIAALKGKAKVAFRSGWLGLDTFGWSTIAIVTEANAGERDDAVLDQTQVRRRLVGSIDGRTPAWFFGKWGAHAPVGWRG